MGEAGPRIHRQLVAVAGHENPAQDGSGRGVWLGCEVGRDFSPEGVTFRALASSRSRMKHIALATLLFAPALIIAASEHASAPFFKLLDRSGDGMIRPEEVDRSPWTSRLDANRDGGVGL